MATCTLHMTFKHQGPQVKDHRTQAKDAKPYTATRTDRGGVDRHVSGGFSSQEVGGNRPVGMDWGERVTPGQALAWPGGEVGLCGNEYCGDRDARTPEPTIA